MRLVQRREIEFEGKILDKLDRMILKIWLLVWINIKGLGKFFKILEIIKSLGYFNNGNANTKTNYK